MKKILKFQSDPLKFNKIISHNVYILMGKRGCCRQYILISSQQLVSDLSVMQAGTSAM